MCNIISSLINKSATPSAPLSGAVVCVRALGCRSSLCEGDALAGALEMMGATVTDDLNTDKNLSAALIVSCSVTAEADRKCRQIVRRARRAVGTDGIVAVSGCWAQGLDADTAQSLGIDILAGSRSSKRILLDTIESEISGGREFTDIRTDPFESFGWDELPMTEGRTAVVFHTRAFVKVQDGCDRFCTYCVIPFMRGLPVSRPIESTLAELRRLMYSGCREVVLTGIHLGRYGSDIGSSLAELVRRISSEAAGLSRLRLGSLEPFSLDKDLLSALAESPIFCPHLHLPMQSGDDGVLDRMGRGCTGDDFIRTCDAARDALGADLHISTDVMVGFPGEDDAAFRSTLRVMRRAGIGRTHVFPFSPRHGTRAEGMTPIVPAEVKAERTAEGMTLGAELLSAYARSFVGRQVEVLAESAKNGMSFGHTPHFLEVQWPDDGTVAPNDIVRLSVKSEREGRLYV